MDNKFNFVLSEVMGDDGIFEDFSGKDARILELAKFCKGLVKLGTDMSSYVTVAVNQDIRSVRHSIVTLKNITDNHNIVDGSVRVMSACINSDGPNTIVNADAVEVIEAVVDNYNNDNVDNVFAGLPGNMYNKDLTAEFMIIAITGKVDDNTPSEVDIVISGIPFDRTNDVRFSKMRSLFTV